MWIDHTHVVIRGVVYEVTTHVEGVHALRKGDTIYVVMCTPAACTCPDAVYRGARCKHIEGLLAALPSRPSNGEPQ